MVDIQLAIGTRDGKPFGLPLSLVTTSLAVLGMKGSGKTWTGGVIEEEMAAANVPFVVLDLMGVHFGIKEKYRVVVFGGDNADVPLSPDLGTELADTVIAENISAIADISKFSRADQVKFAAAFCERLLAANTTPRHIFIEEAQELVPQVVGAAFQASYSAIDRLVRLGRGKGLGSTLLSQRTAQLNKSVLSQCGTIIMLRTVWTGDVAVFHELLRDTVMPAQLEQFMSSIRGLPTGTAWVWSPHDLGIFAQVEIRKRHTFHAGATPTFGKDHRFEPVKVDAGALADRFAAIVKEREGERDELAQAKRVIKSLENKIAGLERSTDLTTALRDALKAVAGNAEAPGDPAIADAIKQEFEAVLAETRADLAEANTRAEALERELAKTRDSEDRTTRGVRLLSEALQLLGVAGGDGATVPVPAQTPIDIDELAARVAARLPNGPTVVVQPKEALRKEYLEREAQRLTAAIQALSTRQRDYLLWIWQFNDVTTLRNWITRVSGKSSTGGSGYQAIQVEIDDMVKQRLVHKDSHGFVVSIEARVHDDLADYKATGAEVKEVVNRAISLLQERKGS